MRKELLIGSLISLLFVGCVEYEDSPYCKKIKYLTFDELRQAVEVKEAREIEKSGKIYRYENLILVSDAKKGIHIIDNSDKYHPKNRAFINVPGNIDITVKDGYMYVDSFMDLVVIDINDLDNIREVNRTKDIFPYQPWNYDAEYQCGYDLSKGVIIGGDND